jgi:sodium-dependent dicarboxylate transporter 2/3/5
MAVWWMTEALPLAVTALLPLILFPTFGIRSIEATTPSYAHPLIFLFLGGFLLARAMHVWGLDKRLALTVLRFAGSSPRGVIAGVMAVTEFLSMWVSNTATAMVMLPIGLSIVTSLPQNDETPGESIAPALLIGIAYAATIGGMGTIIGTPPNALFAAFMAETYDIEISFLRWMLIGVPMVLLLLPLALFATLGFMLPVATPPNAVVFGSGVVEIRHMLRAGAVLDVIGIVVVALGIMTLGQWVFGGA